MVSFDAMGLFTNVPTEEVLGVIKNKLQDYRTLGECSVLHVDSTFELLEVCLKNFIFSVWG
jgi:hypothetical protein